MQLKNAYLQGFRIIYEVDNETVWIIIRDVVL